jgi:hypothetical protein
MINKIESAVRNSPVHIPNLGDFHETYWKTVVPYVSLNGLWMEFGVFRGRSIQKISSLTNNTVYGFDSFDGLHEYWDTNNPKGVYNSGGKIPEGAIVGDNHSMFDSSPTKNIEPWNKNVKLIQGYFENTLPQFLKENKENVAFVNIDSDLYSSCVTVLNNLKHRIVEGTIICFDELLDYPSYKEHEIKAFAEFLIDTGWNIEPLIYNSVGVSYTQASIKIIK